MDTQTYIHQRGMNLPHLFLYTFPITKQISSPDRYEGTLSKAKDMFFFPLASGGALTPHEPRAQISKSVRRMPATLQIGETDALLACMPVHDTV